MKHLFLLNPIAGKKKFQIKIEKDVMEAIKSENIDGTIYKTTKINEPRTFTENYLPGEHVRFYAIGGDGTLNEVVNGILNRSGRSEIALIPCGTGDDFARILPHKEKLTDILSQINGTVRPIDVLKTSAGISSINMINAGIDANTAADVHRFSKYFPGTSAYIVSLLNQVFFHPMGVRMKITIDHNTVIQGKFSLVALGNGSCCGGGFHAAPRADITDGFIEINIAKTVNLYQFATMVGGYKKGTHLDNPKYKDILIYRQGKTVVIETEKPIDFVLDGNVYHSNILAAEIIHNAINFVFP